MFDIGWSELLVIAVVLIVVVGPKDLPPMIRAFGKTMAGLRKMAGDFRSQFDEALKEADMDDVRQTISDVRNLNPTNSIRDAMNPLRQLGNEIRADLKGATTPPSSPATSAPAGAPAVSLAEPDMKLPDGPPAIATQAAAAVTAVGPATAATASIAPTDAAGPVAAAETEQKPQTIRKSASPKSVQEAEAEKVVAKPKRATRTVSAKTEAAKTASDKPVAPKSAQPAVLTEVAAKVTKVKAAKATVAAGKPMVERAKAVVKKTDPDMAASVTPAKTAKTAKAKKGEA
ncbi:Sec-independent protein translocase protein TatB [Rhizobium skierniewicense]|uniref:Sec-independent protein translocase protein TatB n=1 Tax=Rhizobium skierniewicense TaxID=984260 RepID=UPI00157407F0|nr:Sec-independent protein translocase protein TatB [Rhizobium skierniewicense]NTF31648.1 twin-arginine translocase subunit TatB [Rhizobium skierniewicense]